MTKLDLKLRSNWHATTSMRWYSWGGGGGGAGCSVSDSMLHYIPPLKTFPRV